MKNNIENVRKSFEAIRSYAFLNLSELSLSEYWKEEVESLEYIRRASDEVLIRLREHCHWITGVRSYDYKKHHLQNAHRFVNKLELLVEKSVLGPLSPDPEHLGEFGFEWQGGFLNLDTLRYYENIVALGVSGVVQELKILKRRPVICEIGAGWGGLIRQIWREIPDAIIIIIDIPHTLLFSGTYLPTLFPNKKIAFYDPLNPIDDYDLLFVNSQSFHDLTLPNLDLVINTVSFQEMTFKQVQEYNFWALRNSSTWLYSYNRDRGKYNAQLSSVSEVLSGWNNSEILSILDVDHTQLNIKEVSKNPNQYRHQLFSRN